MGYKFRVQKRIEPEFEDMQVGRIIQASLDQSESKIEYSFPVVAVDPGKSFVLKNWGCFLVNEIDAYHTRLIVRTHGQALKSFRDHLAYAFMVPMHYLMERRMLMGIKARAEAGPGMPFSSPADILWFLGVCLAPIAIIGLLIVNRQPKIIFLAILYGMLWLWALFVFDPTPIYSLTLFIVLMINVGWLFKTT
jgi:hypothetical protein